MKNLSYDNLIQSQTTNTNYNQLKSDTPLRTFLKSNLFNLYYHLLKTQDVNLWLEIISIIVQILQLVAFPLSIRFINIWKQPQTFTKISTVINYFQLVLFFEENKQMYIIAFYLCVIILSITIILIIYICYSFYKANVAHINIPLQILRNVLSIISGVGFIPVLNLFLSLFHCNNEKRNIYISEIQCWSNTEYYVYTAFAIVFGVILVIICYLSVSIFYENKSGTHNPQSKSTSFADVFLLIIKIVMLLLFTILTSKNNNQWIVIVFLLFFSFYLLYIFYIYQPYYNNTTMKAYNCLALTFLWSNVVVFLGKCLEFTQFDGAIGLFFLGLPIIVLIVFTEHDKIIANIVVNVSNKKGIKALQQILSIVKVIDRKDINRLSHLFLKGYIENYEETCSLKDCALKKYLTSLKTNNIDAVVFLLQHCESLYQNAISRFPSDSAIRINYAFFLLERMNKKQQAVLELENTEKYNPVFEEQFTIYRYKKMLEEQTSEVNGDSDDNLDIVSNIEYKNHFNLFKSGITKAAALYMEFWSLLLNPNQDSQEDLTKLNDYGSKINTLVEEIKGHFDKIQKLKHNDKDTIKYYADFLNDILNEKENAQKYKNRLNEIEDVKQSPDDNNLINFDINTFNSNSEYQFIVVSAQPEKFGIITNLSLGVCSMFGYTRNELVGKSLEMIMPEIYHKGHHEILLDRLNDFKKQSITLNDMKNYKPKFRDISTFGRNKSRYLVLFTFKTALIPTESNDNVFIAKIWQDICNFSNIEHSTCFIITNNYLTIQNFTPNAVHLLGMSSTAINSTVEITEFIRQFYEEFLKYVIEGEEKTPEQKMLLKRMLLNKKFRTPTVINWKRYDYLFTNKTNTKIADTRTSYDENPYSGVITVGNAYMGTDIGSTFQPSKIAHGKVFNVSALEEVFVLTVNDVIIHGKQEGYAFKFETISHDKVFSKTNNNVSINNTNLTKDNNNNNSISPVKNHSNDKLIKITKKEEIRRNSRIIPGTPMNCSSNTNASGLFGFNNSPFFGGNNILRGNSYQHEQPANQFGGSTLFGGPFIDHNYIPNSQLCFQLDPQALSFKVNHNNKANNEAQVNFKEFLKQEAYKKINPPEPSDTEYDSNDDEENEEEEDDADDDSNAESNELTSSYNANSSNLSNKTNTNNNYNVNNSNANNNTNVVKSNIVKSKNANDVYYKVNMSHIKFCVYDFSKKMVVEIKEWDRIDQVELKTKNSKSQKDFEPFSNIDNPSIDSTIHPNDSSLATSHSNVNADKEGNRENVLIKQIEYALSKEESQPSILKLRLIALCSLLLFLGTGTALLVNVITSQITIKENIELIFHSYLLKVVNSYGVYYARELVLLNNINYTTIPFEREKYRQSILEHVVFIFVRSHDLITYAMTTFLTFSEANQKKLSQTKVSTTIIEDNFDINAFNLSMNSAFIEVNTALFHIGHYSQNDVIPTNKDTFFYLRNSLNDVLIGLDTQAEIFLDELSYNIKKSNKIFIITICAICVVLVVMYLLICLFYEEVAKRKESYLEVFFEIGNNVVRSSLEKCEIFTKKIQSDLLTSDTLSTDDECDYIGEDKLILDKTSNKDHRAKRAYNSSRETKLFKIKILVLIIILFVFCLLIYVFYYLYLLQLRDYMEFYKVICNFENVYLLLFNTLREFMFDNTSPVMNVNNAEFLTTYLENIYTSIHKYQSYISANVTKMPGNYSNTYQQIHMKNLCLEKGEYPLTTEQCLQLLSHSGDHGFDVVLTYFVEEIRCAKTITDNNNYYRNEMGFKFNMTLLGTEQFDALWPTEEEDKQKYEQLLDIRDFNENNVHYNLNIMFINLVMTNHNILRLQLVECIEQKIKNERLTYIVVISVYLGLILMAYLLVWIPFEQQLNMTIYKTKNMLCIIPKEVLASLTNIQKLLDIGQSFAKGNNRMNSK